MRMFLKQERTQTVSSCKQHITTSYKKKITKKSFHPSVTNPFFSAHLSAVSSSVCVRCSFTQHTFFYQSHLKDLLQIEHSPERWIFTRRRKKYIGHEGQTYMEYRLMHFPSTHGCISFLNWMHLTQPWLHSVDCMCCLSGGNFYSLHKKKSSGLKSLKPCVWLLKT